MIICEYCGEEANHTFKNGIHCCSKNVSGCPEIRKRKIRTSVDKYGVNHFKNPAKAKKTKAERYGDENFNNRIKAKATTKEKYGVTNVSLLEHVKETKKSSFLSNYPIDSSQRLELAAKRSASWKSNDTDLIAEKRKASFIKNYGVDNPNKNPEVLERRRQTNLERYGRQPGFGSEKYKQCIKDKYGVDNVSQIAEIHERQQRPKWKSYTLPSGKNINIQGYEIFAIEKLLLDFDEDNIVFIRKNMPVIWYVHETKTKRYYPDFYIASTNTIVEVKSEYTFATNIEVNMLKKDACLEKGFAFEFWIYDGCPQKLRKLIYK